MYLPPRLLTAIIAAGLICASSPVQAAEDCYEIEQVDALTGTQSILISPKAVRIENKANRFVIICKAPDWKVSAYNSQFLSLYQCKFDKFTGRMGFGTNVFGAYLDSLPLSRNKNVTAVVHKGVPCEKRAAINPHPDRSVRKPDKNALPSTIFSNRAEIQEVQSWHWRDPKLPVQAGQLLTKLYRLPDLDGIPVRLQYKTIDNENVIELKTNSIKKVPVDPALFIVPAQCRLVQSELAVCNDARRNQAVRSLVDSWDQWGKIIDADGKTAQGNKRVGAQSETRRGMKPNSRRDSSQR